jgi:hypothetical protein
MGFRLAAALTPGRPHGAPAVAADGAHDAMGVAIAQQAVTEEALGRKEKLLEGL